MLLQGNGFKDAINTVETIAMESMPAGSVAITVTATAIFAQVRGNITLILPTCITMFMKASPPQAFNSKHVHTSMFIRRAPSPTPSLSSARSRGYSRVLLTR